MRRVTGAASAAWWVAFLLACAINLFGIYSPRQPGPEATFAYEDKLAHMLIFAAVAWTGRQVRLPTGWLVGILALHAVVSETVQATLLPQRSGDVFDAVADLLGVLLGIGLAQILSARGRRPREGREARQDAGS
ncbi:VanZ family protein [Actinopolymorpha pittospori]